MHPAGTVDADPDQKVILAEELRPSLIDKRAVGLNGIADGLARRTVAPLKIDHFFKERYAKQGRLTTLPHKLYVTTLLRGDVLRNKALQQRLFHLVIACLRKQRLLFQIVAVSTVKVADRTDRLCHHAKGLCASHGLRRFRIGHHVSFRRLSFCELARRGSFTRGHIATSQRASASIARLGYRSLTFCDPWRNARVGVLMPEALTGWRMIPDGTEVGGGGPAPPAGALAPRAPHR